MTIDEQLDEIVDKIPSVNSSRKYWLIRTQSGEYYSDFVENEYVAIEPSGLTLATIRDLEKKAAGNNIQLAKFIKQHVKDQYFKVNEKEISNRTAGLNTNQIVKFLQEVKEGDIILIPSQHSNQVSIGEVSENKLAEFNEYEYEKLRCPYELRRRVQWLNTIPRNKLDVNLYLLFSTHQAISNINKYANVIERSVNDFYVLFETAHVILNIDTQNGISAKALFGFGNLLMEMLDGYAHSQNVSISSDDIQIEINLNSPGKADFKSKIKKTTLVLGFLTFLGGGGYQDKEGNSLKTDGVPGIVRSLTEYLNARQDREFKEKIFNKYADSLRVRDPTEFNKLMKQYSTNKDLPR